MSWIAAAAWTRPTAARASFTAELPNRLITVFGALLLTGALHPRGSWRLWEMDVSSAWLCLAGVVAGIGFAWWARLHLGALWSGTVTRKAGHRIIDTGPYAIVRHPIYTGALIACFATAVAWGTIDALLGAVLVSVGFWLKAKLEEKFLAEGLGEEVYAAYRARVPMLVPFLRS